MSGRAEIVARARALAGGDLGPRARRLAGRLATPLAFEDVAAAPDWVLWPEPARRELAQATGVAACAPRLRRTIDGKALRIFAETIGPDRLDALLSGPALDHHDGPEVLPDGIEALTALGAAALRAEATDRPELAERLGVLLPTSNTTMTPAAARAACAQARQWMAIDGGAHR